MSPSPYSHFAFAEESGSSGIAAERNLEDAIMPASADPAFKTR
jgi:hypothetical protein